MIKQNIYKIIKFFKLTKDYKPSYSQCGEDLIIDYLCSYLKIDKPVYLDLGANHPTSLNNTYYFYKKGCRGVLIEPDKTIFDELRKVRKYDRVVNVGVGLNSTKSAAFYIMTASVLNTFSKEVAEKIHNTTAYKIKEITNVPLMDINEVIKNYFETCPDIVSIDIEGLDYDVIKSLDFDKYRPKIICVETLEFSEGKDQAKDTMLINYLLDNNYIVYADTFINTIFYDKTLL